MRRNSFLTFLKEKSFLIVLTLMLVSAGTMAALFTLGTDDKSEGNEVAKQEEIQVKTPLTSEEDTKKEEVQETTIPKTNIVKSKETSKSKTSASVNTENAVLQAELEDQYLEAVETEELAEVSTGDVIAEMFSENAEISLLWPVEGEVILPYSMDQSVYFKTLAQYQYNPAVIIGTSEGTEVLASAAGTVIAVDKSNEFGHYVVMDAGNGFEITYGQLFDISTEVGEQLEAGERIAMVAYPTRNYVEEGENLYFKVTKNGESVDPELYLKE